jgi:HAD superfamily hydrolase (TIGR01662 family)
MSTRSDSAHPGLNPKQKLAPRDGHGLPGVFLDRDGTINEEVGHLNHLNRVQVYPWPGKAIRKFNEASVPVIAVTNQSVSARRYFAQELLSRFHEKIAAELATHTARLDAFHFCPYDPDPVVRNLLETVERILDNIQRRADRPLSGDALQHES